MTIKDIKQGDVIKYSTGYINYVNQPNNYVRWLEEPKEKVSD